MQLYQLKPTYQKKKPKRVGRGGKKGTYSGRGLKGQKSRAGRKPRPGFAGGDTLLIKGLPKQRGQRGKLKIRQGRKLSRRLKPVILNLKDIEKKFFVKVSQKKSGAGQKINQTVSPKSLFKKGLISKINKRVPPVKILGQGQLREKLHFKDVQLSKSVQEKMKSTDK
jgi:large subunit ribosomal protein L15